MKMNLEPSYKSVNFDEFMRPCSLTERYNTANELCHILMTYTRFQEDNLFEVVPDEEPLYVTVTNFLVPIPVPTRQIQHSMIASHFARYAATEKDSCDISLPEYHCLKQLMIDIQQHNIWPSHHSNAIRYIKVLNKVCRAFEKAYAKIDDDFARQIIIDALMK
jgi:hypothetical protein